MASKRERTGKKQERLLSKVKDLGKLLTADECTYDGRIAGFGACTAGPADGLSANAFFRKLERGTVKFEADEADWLFFTLNVDVDLTGEELNDCGYPVRLEGKALQKVVNKALTKRMIRRAKKLVAEKVEVALGRLRAAENALQDEKDELLDGGIEV